MRTQVSPVNHEQEELSVRMLSEDEAKSLLHEAGIAVPQRVSAHDPAGAAEASKSLRFPVVIKAVVPGLAHKSEIGGVVVGLDDPAAVDEAARAIAGSVERHLGADRLEGFLVEEMIVSGTELLIGSSEDPVFGTLLAFGLGGVLTELLDDASFRAVPLQPWDPLEMVQDLRGAAVLEGLRGQSPVDVGAVAELLMTIGGPSGLLTSGRVRSIELNPVVATPRGLVALDAVIEVEERV